MGFDKLIKAILKPFILGLLKIIFSGFNISIAWVASNAGTSPEAWNSEIFTTMEKISEDIFVPIAGMVLTAVICHELIQNMTQKSTLEHAEVSFVYIWLFKACMGVYLLSHVTDIVMGIFEIVNWAISKIAVPDKLTISADELYQGLEKNLDLADVPSLMALSLQSCFITVISFALAIWIMVLLFGRMFEIYIYIVGAPIPFATFLNKEWSDIGKNYVKNLLSLAFQGLFMLVVLAIYGALVKNLAFAAVESLTDYMWAYNNLLVYAIVVAISLTKTRGFANRIFGAS